MLLTMQANIMETWKMMMMMPKGSTSLGIVTLLYFSFLRCWCELVFEPLIWGRGPDQTG